MKTPIIRPFECSSVRHSVFAWLLPAIAFCLLPASFCKAQSDILKYARQIIDTLAAPGMHGRGYVNKGDSIAADYLSGQFRKIGLKSFGATYYQKFTLSVNTFPDDLGLGFRGTDKYFENGEFVLIGPNSPSTEYTRCKVLWFDSSAVSSRKNLRRFKKNDFSDKVIVIDSKGINDKEQLDLIAKAKQNPYGAKGIVVFNNKKLTWHVSQTVASFPTFELLVPDSLNKARHQDFQHMYFFVNSKFIPDYKSQNVIGYIRGTQYPDSFLVFSAHYDHLGQMGKYDRTGPVLKDVYFPGANDNASGCAMLLNLAKYYSEHPPKYSIAFIAFGAEEAGLLGSKHYVENPLFPLKNIKFLINMDIMGTGDEGIKVVNGSVHKKEFDQLVGINSEKKLIPSVQPRGKAANSDHFFFEEAGVKTFFIYTLGGIKAYHDIYDRPESLPLTEFEDIHSLLIEFVNTF